jgi:hypothetical protein
MNDRLMTSVRVLSLAVVLAAIAPSGARAIIIMGDPGRQTTPAPFDLNRFVGRFGTVLATAVSPRHFVSAAHAGGSTTAAFDDGTGRERFYSAVSLGNAQDLSLYRIGDNDPDLPTYAPLWTNSNEIGKDVIAIGLGTQRGAEVRDTGGELRGWTWGASDSMRSWGTNVVSDLVTDPTMGDLLTFSFDRGAGPTEGIYSALDSGGPMFVRDPADGAWKLAGVAYAVDGNFATSQAGPYSSMALFDARGFWVGTSPDDGVFIDPATASGPVPSSSYATRISSRLGFLNQASGGVIVPEPSAWLALAIGLTLLGPARLVVARRTGTPGRERVAS